MVSHNQVRTVINGELGQIPLIPRRIVGIFFTPVIIHHNPIHLIPHRFHIRFDGLHIPWVGPRCTVRRCVPIGVVIAEIGN